MAFTFDGSKIKGNNIVFIYEECAYPGLRRAAGWVRDDIADVFGAKPIAVEYANFADTAAFYQYPVFFGTVGNSVILDKLADAGALDLFAIAHEREVYSFSVIDDLEYEGFHFESALVIAGSDKRGSIYGLLKLSEMLGVSPFTDWLDIKPQKLSQYTIGAGSSFVSKTPSVYYRGFFINDEWPAFGNFCTKRYGGFTAKMYEHVFELLLRLKGNYLWPAMWSSVFYDDGPGMASADLADELGVIMGTSHHEPCMRQGEEYSHVRGKDSIYGDAWDFVSNREGIIKFWEDSLEERSRLENVVTVGMRGEADTPILSSGSTLADNAALLRDVIATQNGIIHEKYQKDIMDIPRMLALYKEVEPFYYGDGKIPGIKGCSELDGVTLLLCDDNFGNLRRLPDEDERDHAGGFGMYYHFDYHGDPISYEWFNTSYLPKVWEQMTSAYDNGIRKMWIVNVGDIFTNEYPLAFFLDLAYDFDRWGTNNRASAREYTGEFVRRNIPHPDEKVQKEAADLLLGYTSVTYRRRTEAMNADVYAPFAFAESERQLGIMEDLEKTAQRLYRDEYSSSFAFYELVYLPLTAVLNVQKMWIYTGMNHAYARMGSTVANTLAGRISDCIREDRKLVDALHTIHKGKWYGMGLSEHIGFKYWCEEQCQYPIVHTFECANKPRLIVSIPSTGEYTEGGFWTGRELTLPDAIDPSSDGGYIELSTASAGRVSYSIESDDGFIKIEDHKRSVKCGKSRKVFALVDRSAIDPKEKDPAGTIRITSENNTIVIRVPVGIERLPEKTEKNTYTGIFNDDGSGYISIAAVNWSKKTDSKTGSFETVEGLGREGSSVKAYPQNVIFAPDDSPKVTYSFMIEKAGMYDISLYTTPVNPPYPDNLLLFTYSVNSKDAVTEDMIPEGYSVAAGNAAWSAGVLDNIRIKTITARFTEGINELTIGALYPGFVLEKIVITHEGEELPYSYLGPQESFHS